MISIVKGDITKMKTEAIVNAANNSLLGGGGVDGAIHRAGGPEILAECRKIREKQGGCHTGEAVITGGGNLPARYVIHTVGPIWYNKGTEQELLASAYRNSLKLAAENGVTTIAFPNISTGVYGFPKLEAAKIAVETVKKFMQTNESIKEVIFCCFDDENYRIYKKMELQLGEQTNN